MMFCKPENLKKKMTRDGLQYETRALYYVNANVNVHILQETYVNQFVMFDVVLGMINMENNFEKVRKI